MALNRGLWTIVGTAVAVGTGIVIGEQLRGQATAGGGVPSTGGGPEFRLAQGRAGGGGPTGGPRPGGPGSSSPFGSGGPFSGGATGVIRGVIESINPGTNLIHVRQALPGSSGTQSVRVDGSTQILHMVRATASELKVGDRVTASGVPLQMEVTDLQVAMEPPRSGASGTGGPMPGSGGPGGFSGGGDGPRPGPGMARANVVGQIASTNPLRVQLGDGVQCALNLRPGATVSRMLQAQLRDLRPGETINGYGMPGEGGVLQARQLMVGIPENPSGFGGGGGGASRRGGGAGPSGVVP